MITHLGTISNCAAFGDVVSTVEGVEPQAGGFTGYIQHSTISNSHAAGTITVASSRYKAGGFAGETYYDTGEFHSSSFDIEKNAGLQAIGGETPADTDGVETVPTQTVKTNICKDYYGKHILKAVAERPATCTEDGHEAYWKCENCGLLFADENGTQQIEKPEVIPATGAEDPGTGEAAAAPAKDNADKFAETGDDSNVVLYGILALLAAGGAAGTFYRRRKA